MIKNIIPALCLCFFLPLFLNAQEEDDIDKYFEKTYKSSNRNIFEHILIKTKPLGPIRNIYEISAEFILKKLSLGFEPGYTLHKKSNIFPFLDVFSGDPVRWTNEGFSQSQHYFLGFAAYYGILQNFDISTRVKFIRSKYKYISLPETTLNGIHITQGLTWRSNKWLNIETNTGICFMANDSFPFVLVYEIKLGIDLLNL
ncbi:MAG: hypothetical protein RQ866_00335 [Bacteroidales bacterium]|nr:hypothetical protein [Bacteroidales bacterium]